MCPRFCVICKSSKKGQDAMVNSNDPQHAWDITNILLTKWTDEIDQMGNAKICAFVWAEGDIQFSESLPEGAVKLAAGERKRIMPKIKSYARACRTDEGIQYYLPGIPEAQNDEEKILAVIRFWELLFKTGILPDEMDENGSPPIWRRKT